MIKIFAAVGLIQVLSILINLARTKIIAVLLGPEGVGVISIIDQVTQLMSYVSSLSLPFAAVKYLSKSHSDSDASFISTYSAFIKALLILSSLATLVVFFTILSIPEIIGSELLEYKNLLLISLFSVPAMVLGGFFNSVFAAAERPKTASILAVLTTFVFTLLASIGILLGSIEGFYIGNLIAGAVISIGAIYYLNTRLSLPINWNRASIFSELRKNPSIIPFALLFFITSVAYSASYLVARYGMMSFHGEYEAGLLHSLIALSVAIGLVLTPINGLLLVPRVNRNIAIGEKIDVTIDFLKIMILVLSIVGVPIILFPKTTLYILFSEEFTSVSRFLFLFIIAQCFLQISGVFSSLLIGLDDVKMYALISCTGHILFGVFAWLLVENFSYPGVGLSLIGSALFALVVQFFRLRSQHHFRTNISLYMLAVYVLGVMLLIGFISTNFEEWDIINTICRVSIYLVFIASLYFFLNSNEKGMIKEGLSKFKFIKPTTKN